MTIQVTGNRLNGVLISDALTDAKFSDGDYSNNGGDGIEMARVVGNVMLTGVKSESNVDGAGFKIGDDVIRHAMVRVKQQ